MSEEQLNHYTSRETQTSYYILLIFNDSHIIHTPPFTHPALLMNEVSGDHVPFFSQILLHCFNYSMFLILFLSKLVLFVFYYTFKLLFLFINWIYFILMALWSTLVAFVHETFSTNKAAVLRSGAACGVCLRRSSITQCNTQEMNNLNNITLCRVTCINRIKLAVMLMVLKRKKQNALIQLRLSSRVQGRRPPIRFQNSARCQSGNQGQADS